MQKFYTSDSHFLHRNIIQYCDRPFDSVDAMDMALLAGLRDAERAGGALYQMSDVNPAKVHITLPKGFRVQRHIPSYLTVHTADLPETEITKFEGMPITTPVRTVRDCLASHLGPALVRQAIEDGQRKNRLTLTFPHM